MLTRLEEVDLRLTTQLNALADSLRALLARLEVVEELLFDDKGENEGGPETPDTGE